jgi:hypothetical protein
MEERDLDAHGLASTCACAMRQLLLDTASMERDAKDRKTNKIKLLVVFVRIGDLT